MGFCFRTVASNFIRSASAAAVTRMRLASASERFFCLGGGFGILQRGFLAGLGFELGLFDLLLLQGQGVLHGIGFGLGLKDADLCLRFSLLHIAGFLSIRFKFGDLDFFELDVLFGAETLVLLFLQKEAFETLGIIGRKLNVAEEHFADENAVTCQASFDGIGGLAAQFFALHRENFAGHI